MGVPGAVPENNTVVAQPGAGEDPPIDAKLAGQAGADGDADDDSVYSDPLKAKELAKSLRGEAAKHRTEKKALEGKLSALMDTQKKLKAAFGMEDEETDPLKVADAMKSKNEALEIEIQLTRLEKKYGIGDAEEKYFRFLVNQKLEELADEDEVSEEQLAEIAKEVKATVGAKPTVNQTGLGGKKPTERRGADDVSLEQFVKMNMSEKSLLYSKDVELYQRLMTEAKDKRLLK